MQVFHGVWKNKCEIELNKNVIFVYNIPQKDISINIVTILILNRI